MLADTVVNVVRRRNMDNEQKKRSDKWQWTLRTLEWLLAQLPPSSRFQVYLFNTEGWAVIEGSDGEWLDAADSLALEDTVEAIQNYAPSAGTSLVNAFSRISDFELAPDNIFLLTDGLPTQGQSSPRKYMISGEQRRKYFSAAMKIYPNTTPLNTILFPMEGDPEAAALFWQSV